MSIVQAIAASLGVGPTPTQAGITSVSGTSQFNAWGSGITISHEATGDNRYALVEVSTLDYILTDDNAISGITYGGVSMGLVGEIHSSSGAYHMHHSYWGLVAPALGAQDVVVTYANTGNISGFATAMSFAGVNQSTPAGTFASSTSADDSGVASQGVASAAGELVVGTIWQQPGDSTSHATSSTGATILADTWLDSRAWNVVIGTEPGAATTTFGWTLPLSWTVRFLIGVPLKPV